MTKITMESPLGYALDALAVTRGNSAVRALPFGNQMYTLIFRRPGYEGWPNTLADYEAMDQPKSVKDAVKRLLIAFREASGQAYLTFELSDDFDEFIASTRFTTSQPATGTNWVAIEVPPHYTSETEVQEQINVTRPDLILTSIDANGRGLFRLNPEFWSPIQMRFAADAGYDGATRINIGSVQRVSNLFAVGPRGGIEQVGDGTPQNAYRLNLPSVSDIESALTSARNSYRDRVMRRLRNSSKADNSEFEAKRAEHRVKTAANFTKHRQSVKRIEEMVIPTLPFVPNGVKASRRWGIEIETGAGRDIKEYPSGWDTKGDGSLESAYGGYRTIDPENCPDYSYRHGLPEDDEDYYDPSYCDSCGEVYMGGYQSGDCVEVVSPILTSMHSRGLKLLTDQLEFAPRTDSAGIHVHVEAKDLTVGQVRELVLSYDHLEPLIESSYDRVERGYCKRRSTSELLEIARHGRDNADRPARETRTGDRYVTVNLQALDYHGTVEFRAMGPIYNYDHLVRWAMFCREMVNVAKAGARSKEFAKVRSFDDVLAIFAKYGSEYNMAAGFAEPVVTEEAELQAV